MKVFKFGGASVRDAAGIRNVATILRRFSSENLAVVVSAMGKTTNALEDLTRAYAKGKGDKDAILAKIHEDHIKEMDDLFENNRNHPVYAAVAEVFSGIQKRFDVTASANYDLVYDQIVSQGEFISSVIVSHYMNAQGIENTWYDARTIIRTDSTFREGKVDWEIGRASCRERV